MARYLVDVMLKPEISDPQGAAILGALATLGLHGIGGVRQGKHFEVDVAGEPDKAALARVHDLAGTLLANPVIEDFTVRLQS